MLLYKKIIKKPMNAKLKLSPFWKHLYWIRSFLNTFSLNKKNTYRRTSVIPPVKSDQAEVALPPTSASYDPFSLAYAFSSRLTHISLGWVDWENEGAPQRLHTCVLDLLEC